MYPSPTQPLGKKIATGIAILKKKSFHKDPRKAVADIHITTQTFSLSTHT